MPDTPTDSDADADAGESGYAPGSGTDPARRARTYILDTTATAETVGTVLQCADHVAAEWDGEPTDGSRVADLLRAELEASGAWERLPDVLAGATRAAGLSLPARPVADPPYVTATSRGPMLRATVSEGRLVILLQAFEVERGPTRYVREPKTPGDAVRASFK